MQYNFFREETRQWEKVGEEAWKWIATYQDSTQLHQFDPATLRFHQFREIDQSRLMLFEMVNEQLGRKVTFLFNPDNMKLIHFYRHPLLENATIKLKIYFFGVEKKLGGETFSQLIGIMPDNSIVCCEHPDQISVIPQ